MKLWQGRAGLIAESSSPGGGQALDQAPWGSGHGSEVLEFKKRLDSALRDRVWFLIGLRWSQELDSMTLIGPFQHFDSIIPNKPSKA